MTPNRPAPPRMLCLETGHNFRDIGGYPSEDGRHVRWRRVFRSGVMSRITGDDATQLHELGIDTICDLRTNSERRRRPTLWHEGGATTLWERDHQSSGGALTELTERADLSAADVRAVMRDVYKELPYEQADGVRELFRRIAEGHLPLVFNCSAGKDRTGVAAALLLSALGVPRAFIEEDYLLTNEFLPRLIPLLQADSSFGNFVRDRPDAALPLLRAEHEYLAAMFESIAARDGSVADYLQNVAGVTPAELAAIRAELLL